MDGDIINMEESIMTVKNMFNYMCGTIIKTPASKEVSATQGIEHVLHVHDELLHVLVVAEHLLFVLIMTNLTALDAGVLIMVPHM